MLDARGLACVQVLLLTRARIVDLPPESAVTVATDDPAAPLDLPAWCHLTGHRYLGPVQSDLGQAYRIELAAGAAVVDRRRPWAVQP